MSAGGPAPAVVRPPRPPAAATRWARRERPDGPAPDVIVVGAGLAGLTAACLLARAGRRVEVHEQHVAPGGYATSFARRAPDGTRHVFDVSLHSLGGLDAGGLVRANLERCGVWDDLAPLRLSHQYRWRTPDEDLRVPQGPAAYVEALAAGDAAARADLAALVDEMTHTLAQYRQLQARHFQDLVTNARAYDRVVRYSRLPQEALLRQFVRDPRVRARVASQWAYHGAPPSRLPAIAFVVSWAEYALGGAYYLGGRGESLVRALVRALEAAGGRLHLRSRVHRVRVAQGRCLGVELADGTRRDAPCVIANTSPGVLATSLVEPGALPEAYARRVAGLEPSLSTFTLHLALDRPLADLGGPADYMLVDAPTADAEVLFARARAGAVADGELTIVAHDAAGPAAGVPEGRGQLAVAALTASEPWLGDDPARYQARKARTVEAVLDRLERIAPGLRRHVTIAVAGTPRTNVRYTGNPGGAIYGYLKDVAQSGRTRGLSRTPIEGLHVASAWAFPGGGYSGAVWAGHFCVYENALAPTDA